MRTHILFRQTGATLIELIAFIVVAGIVAVALVQAFGGAMRGAYMSKEITQAAELAQQRMEVIAGQRDRLGFSGFVDPGYDPCKLGVAPWTTAAVCATTSYAAGSFAVDSTLTTPGTCSVTCKEVTVTVNGPDGGRMAELVRQFRDY
jgi:type II secretory pathway pseudopilin PulG